MNSPFLSALGLCKKAGALVRGRDETFSAVSAGKINTVFIAVDISERSKKEVINSLGNDISIISLKYTKEQLGYAAGVKPMAIFSVGNDGLLNLLKNKAAHEEADI